MEPMKKPTLLFLSALCAAGMLFMPMSGRAAASEAAAGEEAAVQIEAREYTLRREAAEEEPAEEEETAGEEPSSSQDLVLAQSLDGIALPADSEQVTYNYKGEAVYIARTTDGLLLLPVLQEDGSVRWYVYTESTDTAIPYLRFSSNVMNYVVLSPEADVEIPKEFSPILISMSDDPTLLPAYENRLLEDDMLFFYGMDSSGNRGFFRCDRNAGQIVRYVPDETIPEPTTTVAPTDDPKLIAQIDDLRARSAEASLDYENLNQDHEHKMLYGTIIIIGLGALCLILLLVIAIVAAKLKNARADAEEAMEEAEHRSRQHAGMQTGRRRQDEHEPNANGEGTSEIRRSVRRDSELGKTSSTSEVKPASRHRRIERSGRDEDYSGTGSQEQRPVRRRSSQDYEEEGTVTETVRRPVRKKPEGQISDRYEDSQTESGARRSPESRQPAKRRQTEEGPRRRSADEDGDTVKRVRRKRPETADRETDEWARRGDDEFRTGRNADAGEDFRSAKETVRVTADKAEAAAEALVEEEDEAFSGEDFDVTDFQDI